MRVGPDGQRLPQIVISLTQKRELKIEGATEPQFFYGGATLIVDLRTAKVQYAISKRINSAGSVNGKTREQRAVAFLTEASRDPLQALLLTPKAEPFAALHSFADVET